MRDIENRKQLIQALLAFKDNRKSRDTGLSHVYYNNGDAAASDGLRMLVVRLGEDTDACYLNADALKAGRLEPAPFERPYPNYRGIIPKKPRLDDYTLFTVPEWLKHYSRAPRREQIWAELNTDGELIIPPAERKFRLELLDALHGLRTRAYHIDNALLLEQDSDDPDWRCMILTRTV